MTESLRHQAASGHMPLGVFHNGELLAVVPAGDPYGTATRDALAGERGLRVNPPVLEVLLLCHRHPTVAAVDCLDCVPEEG